MQPQYDKTLRIYHKLHQLAGPEGLVTASLRQVASCMGYQSWSTLRWHILHLEEAHLLQREGRKIRILDMTVFEPDMVRMMIAQVPRQPWNKRTKQEVAA